MAERFKAPVLKTGRGLCSLVSSNLTPSAPSGFGRQATSGFAFTAVTRYRGSHVDRPAADETNMSVPAERMRMMRERRRRRGLRELRLVVPDARLQSVRRRIADEVARLDRSKEEQALSWIEAVSEFDRNDANGR